MRSRWSLRGRPGLRLEQQRGDLVAFGRPFIANPDLVERFARDASLNAADQSTFYGGGEQGYIDYPTLTAY